MPFIYLMSLKLIKTTQKCLIVWNLLGALINKVFIKVPNLSFIRFISFKFFETRQKRLLFSNLLRQLLEIKSS